MTANEAFARLDRVQLWIFVTALEMHQRGELTFEAALDRIKSECDEYDARRREDKPHCMGLD